MCIWGISVCLALCLISVFGVCDLLCMPKDTLWLSQVSQSAYIGGELGATDPFSRLHHFAGVYMKFTLWQLNSHCIGYAKVCVIYTDTDYVHPSLGCPFAPG